MASIFIPFASAARFDEIVKNISPDAEVCFTAPAAELDVLAKKFSGVCSVKGFSASASQSLEDVAPIVVDAAEKLGGISVLVYAPALRSTSSIFLDMPEEEFMDHLNAVGGLFNLCKCAIPYMMGQVSPKIVIALPKEADNAASAVFAASAEAIAEKLSKEFLPYGISVLTV